MIIHMSWAQIRLAAYSQGSRPSAEVPETIYPLHPQRQLRTRSNPVSSQHECHVQEVLRTVTGPLAHFSAFRDSNTRTQGEDYGVEPTTADFKTDRTHLHTTCNSVAILLVDASANANPRFIHTTLRPSSPGLTLAVASYTSGISGKSTGISTWFNVRSRTEFTSNSNYPLAQQLGLITACISAIKVAKASNHTQWPIEVQGGLPALLPALYRPG